MTRFGPVVVAAVMSPPGLPSLSDYTTSAEKLESFDALPDMGVVFHLGVFLTLLGKILNISYT